MPEPRPLEDRVPANLKGELARKGSSPADLADLLGITVETVRRKIRGEVPMSLAEVDKYAAALEIPVDDLTRA